MPTSTRPNALLTPYYQWKKTMSRLPPALGIAPLAGRQQAMSKHQQAFEQDTGRITERVHLISRESVDASLQGGDLSIGLVACWHPHSQIIAVATSTAVVEYDAISGCRRNYVESQGSPVKLRYTPNGTHLVLLTKERNITAWSTSSWRRYDLLVADTKYAKRPLVSGLFAITAGKSPVILYSPVGKATLRTVHLNLAASKAGNKIEKEYLPGYKLKTDNKKPIVAIAAHPSDGNVAFLLLVDGSLLVCGVHQGTLSTMCGIAVPFDANRERVQLHAVPHPTRPAEEALIFVEAERSGLTVLSVFGRNEVRTLGTLTFGAGGLLCGVGMLHRSRLLVAAVRHAGGNVGLRSWRVHTSSRETLLMPATVSPGTLWDAMHRGFSDGANSFSTLSEMIDIGGGGVGGGGEGGAAAVIACMIPHGPSNTLAFWTTGPDEIGAAHFRLPLVHVIDGEDPLEGLGAPQCLGMHTSPSFWVGGGGGIDESTNPTIISKLHFPKYTYVMNLNRVSSYDVTHGSLTNFMAPPTINRAGQERALVRAVYSPRQGIWLAFFKIVSHKEGALLDPGQYEGTAVADHEAAIAAGQWTIPSRDGIFAGGRDELTVFLSNSGDLVAVFETAKLATSGAKASFVAELKCTQGSATRLFQGPPVHIPTAPDPRPEMSAEGNESEDDGNETDEEMEQSLREWETKEAKRLETPKKMLILSTENILTLVDISPTSLSTPPHSSTTSTSAPSTYYHHSSSAHAGQKRVLPSIRFDASESVLQVSWQYLLDQSPTQHFHRGLPGASSACACVAAILTTQRIFLATETLHILAVASFPGDAGVPTSCLWVGPALLVTTSANQVFQAHWNGTITHVASLLSGPPATLVAALADRIVLATRGNSNGGLLAGNTEVAHRGFVVLPCMLTGWAGVASRGILPGGHARARHALRVLLSSYDASRISVDVLDSLAVAGFAEVASAAASCSELASPERKACFAASAGNWDGLMGLVMDELEEYSNTTRSIPPRNSPLYNKVVALARTCEAHGKFNQARSLFESVGAWNELFAICIFQADFHALQSYARSAGREWQGLADQLIAVNENNFRRGASGKSVYGGKCNSEDWKVEVGCQKHAYASNGGDNNTKTKTKNNNTNIDGDDMQMTNAHLTMMHGTTINTESGSDSIHNGLELDIAPSGRYPFMEASLRVTLAAAASGNMPLLSQSRRGSTSTNNKKKMEKGHGHKDDSHAETNTQEEANNDENKEKEEEEDDDAIDEEPIPLLDLSLLESYLGVAGATLLKNATTTSSSPTERAPTLNMDTQGSLSRMDTASSSDFHTLSAVVGGGAGGGGGGGAAGASSPSLPSLLLMGGGDGSEIASAPGSEAGALPQEKESKSQQAGARGSGNDGRPGGDSNDNTDGNSDDDFFSSDDEDGGAMGGRGYGSSTSNRLIFTIKSNDSGTPGPGGGGGSSGADTASLRAAVSGLSLGGPRSMMMMVGSSLSGRSSLDIGGGGGGMEMPRSDRSQVSDLAASSSPSLSSTSLDQGIMSLSTTTTPIPAAPLLQQQSTSPFLNEQSLEDPFASQFATTTTIAGGNVSSQNTKASTITSKDPFAALPGLPQTLAQAASRSSSTVPTPTTRDTTTTTTTTTTTSGGNTTTGHHNVVPGIKSMPISEDIGLGGSSMRPQPQPPVPQSDLLAGWDEFEALFATTTTTTSTNTAINTASINTVVDGSEKNGIKNMQEEVLAVGDGDNNNNNNNNNSDDVSKTLPTPSASASTPAPTQTSTRVAPPSTSKKAYKNGIEAFRKGQWAKAVDYFASALASTSKSKESKESIRAFQMQCLQEYAAAVLVQRAAAAPPAAASRLSRYAAALPLGQELRAVTTAFAIEANMAAQNFGWAGDQLMWLVMVCAEGQVSGPGLDPGSLQEKLSACDRANGTNALMNDGNEDVESFAAILASCATKGDVDELLTNLTQN